MDAKKCFDKLWPKDGLLELHKLGWSEKVVMMLFRLNHIANITVKTPVDDNFTEIQTTPYRSIISNLHFRGTEVVMIEVRLKYQSKFLIK